jgi:hypothetical protein
LHTYICRSLTGHVLDARIYASWPKHSRDDPFYTSTVAVPPSPFSHCSSPSKSRQLLFTLPFLNLQIEERNVINLTFSLEKRSVPTHMFATSEMRQSASSHSLIPIRTNPSEINNRPKKVDAQSSFGPHGPPSSGIKSIAMSASVKRGQGSSGSPSRSPLDERLKSVFSHATTVQKRSENSATARNRNIQIKSTSTVATRAPIPGNLLSEPFRTSVMGPKDQLEAPSPTYSTAISPSFIVRNLDEDPHNGLTPTSAQGLGLKTPIKTALRLPTDFPSPPSSPEIAKSRLPRRSKDDLSLTDISRKLQAVSSSAVKPRRISIPGSFNLNAPEKPGPGPEPEMTIGLDPPAPITIPPNEFNDGYPADKTISSSKSPRATLGSLFRWNTAPAEPSADRLLTPSTSSRPVSPMTPTSPSITALEQELRTVSAELAFSIQREMDLEDVITRLQEEIAGLGGEGKRRTRLRTSDYFSENSYQGSPPLHPVDDSERKRHSRMSSVAVEDIRLANEKVTQLEKEILVLKHENLELQTLKRETEKKLKEQQVTLRNSKQVQELETSVEQLRQELIEKTRTIDALQQKLKRFKDDTEEIQKLTERVKDTESQREAVQLALRQLRERQSLEAKKAADRIKQLEAEKEKGTRPSPRSPERTMTGITSRAPDSVKRPSTRSLEEKINQLEVELSKSSKEIAGLTIANTHLSTQNTQLQDLQQRLQSRLSQMEAATSALTISEASATASLSHAHRLAVEMAQVTDSHVKSLEKVRTTANNSLPHLKNGMPLSPMLQSAYDFSLSPIQMSRRQGSRDDATVQMMESRIQELEGALQESSSEMGEVVRKMQIAQIEMIELAGERDEALRRERQLLREGAKVEEFEVIDNTTETNN